MNVPGLVKIECMDYDKVSMPFRLSGNVGAANFTGTWVNVPFIPTTAGFKSTKRLKGGYDTILQFQVEGLEATTIAMVRNFAAQPKVYRVKDLQGAYFIIGSNHCKGELEMIMNNKTLSGSRGFDVEVRSGTSHFPPLYI